MREPAVASRNHLNAADKKTRTFGPAFHHFLGWQTPVEGGCPQLEQSDSKMCKDAVRSNDTDDAL